MTYWLDINVLVALFDAADAHHDAAHCWFAGVGAASWATCPITENGLIRVLSNPAYPTVFATPVDVTQRLRIFCSQPGHAFWSDVVSLTDSTLFDISRLRGHQQITDLYLAGLAARQGGRLATFDEHIPLGALVNVPRDVALVIPA
ncbi:MAG: VapC toxin family PIN domain ribonuclease [Planctomycetes bacterium]|nr:VapC toxin family PIN domain ribonuclease [Planctomycetota bacterium]